MPPSPSVCVSVCVSLLSFLGLVSVKCMEQRLHIHIPALVNLRNNRRILGLVCLWACMCIPLSLFGKKSAKMFLRQRRIIWDVVFYAVRVISKESMRLDFLRTYYLFFLNCINRVVNIWFLWTKNWKFYIYLDAQQHFPIIAVSVPKNFVQNWILNSYWSWKVFKVYMILVNKLVYCYYC
jgi:hypothetical protein